VSLAGNYFSIAPGTVVGCDEPCLFAKHNNTWIF